MADSKFQAERKRYTAAQESGLQALMDAFETTYKEVTNRPMPEILRERIIDELAAFSE